MNLLIIKADEFSSQQKAIIRGERASYIYNFHDLKPGISIKAAVFNGAAGIAQIEAVSASQIELNFIAQHEAVANLPVHALVSIPRPQTIKKVLQLGCMLGLSSVCFFKSSKVVKSYLSSKALTLGKIEEQVIIGLEQAGTSLAPEVAVCASFEELLDNYLPKLNQNAGKIPAIKVLADTQSAKQDWASLQCSSQEQAVLIAIGPESGFSRDEIAALVERGFCPLSLGRRILRVDVALCAAFSRIQFLKEIRCLRA